MKKLLYYILTYKIFIDLISIFLLFVFLFLIFYKHNNKKSTLTIKKLLIATLLIAIMLTLKIIIKLEKFTIIYIILKKFIGWNYIVYFLFILTFLVCGQQIGSIVIIVESLLTVFFIPSFSTIFLSSTLILIKLLTLNISFYTYNHFFLFFKKLIKNKKKLLTIKIIILIFSLFFSIFSDGILSSFYIFAILITQKQISIKFYFFYKLLKLFLIFIINLIMLSFSLFIFSKSKILFLYK